MSVFSLDVGAQNPVTAEVLDGVCDELGMKINDDEKDEYQRLLAVYHDSVVSLLALPGTGLLIAYSASTSLLICYPVTCYPQNSDD